MPAKGNSGKKHPAKQKAKSRRKTGGAIQRTTNGKSKMAIVAQYQPDKRLTQVAEDPVIYIFPNNAKRTMNEKIKFVRTGVTKKILVNIKNKTNLDYDKLAKVLSVGRATLINKNGNRPFNLALSDRIVGLADLYDQGYKVFGDTDNFNEWMFTPNRALGGQKPYDIIDTQYGKDEVRDLIGRIDYGVYS
jgi:putative toxin-antitoxin system antitoxin component (TIGR02293 family)